jgi:hypothetical protein
VLNAGAFVTGAVPSSNATAGLQMGGSTNPELVFVCASGATDSKVWDVLADTNSWKVRILNDARSSSQVVLQAIRSGVSANVNMQVSDDAGTLQTIGYRDAPQNLQTGSYGLVLADRGKSVQFNGVGPFTCTIPANSSVAYPVGTTIVLCNNSSSALTISIPGSDSLVLAGTGSGGFGVSRTLASNGLATLYKGASQLWFVSGAGAS